MNECQSTVFLYFINRNIHICKHIDTRTHSYFFSCLTLGLKNEDMLFMPVLSTLASVFWAAVIFLGGYQENSKILFTVLVLTHTQIVKFKQQRWNKKVAATPHERIDRQKVATSRLTKGKKAKSLLWVCPCFHSLFGWSQYCWTWCSPPLPPLVYLTISFSVQQKTAPSLHVFYLLLTQQVRITERQCQLYIYL